MSIFLVTYHVPSILDTFKCELNLETLIFVNLLNRLIVVDLLETSIVIKIKKHLNADDFKKHLDTDDFKKHLDTIKTLEMFGRCYFLETFRC